MIEIKLVTIWSFTALGLYIWYIIGQFPKQTKVTNSNELQEIEFDLLSED